MTVQWWIQRGGHKLPLTEYSIILCHFGICNPSFWSQKPPPPLPLFENFLNLPLQFICPQKILILNTDLFLCSTFLLSIFTCMFPIHGRKTLFQSGFFCVYCTVSSHFKTGQYLVIIKCVTFSHDCLRPLPFIKGQIIDFIGIQFTFTCKT